jgi:AraC-like DNA-binding protein
MPQTNELFFALVFFASLMGLVVAGILIFINNHQPLAPRLLGLYVFLFSITILHVGLSFTDFYRHYPHFWRSTAWATFCAPVVAYLYVRTVLYQSFRLKKTDALFFLPALLYSLNLLPYYLKSSSEKLVVVSNFMADKSLIAKEPEGMLPQGWGVIARCVLGIVFVVGQYVMLGKMKQRILQSSYTTKQNVTTYRWLFFFTSVLFVFYIIVSIEHIFHFIGGINLSTLIFFTMTGTIFFITFYLLVRPNILYGFKGWIWEPPAPQSVVTPSFPVEEKRPYLTAAQGNLYKELVEGHLNTNMPFLKSGYKVRDLCEELEIPAYQMSAFINQEYGKNFNELINGFRVAYIGNLLKESPQYFNFTLGALANKAGFNSRNSFFNAVKKVSGRTPAEYYGMKTASPAYSDI